MKYTTTAAVSASIAAALLTAPAFAASYPGQQFANKAHVSIAEARSIALRTVHGSIASQELEYERGGSGLRYTFDVKTTHGTREVGIDAKNGAVLENTADTPTSDTPDGAGEKGEAKGD